MFIPNPDSESGSLFFTHPGPRGQNGTGTAKYWSNKSLFYDKRNSCLSPFYVIFLLLGELFKESAPVFLELGGNCSKDRARIIFEIYT